jgi:pSer/pThr/pTyr-binding forkhead associated (FHA) protein
METTVFHIPRPGFAATPDPMWQIRVEVVGGPMDGLRQRVNGDRLEIGRGTDNDLCLTLDAGVSGRHARIVREGRSFWLEDLGSRNGTYLGEERLVDRVPIGPGATFAVSRTQVQFMPR